MTEYHLMTVAEKLEHALGRARPRPVRCPACGVQVLPAQLEDHRRRRCAHREGELDRPDGGLNLRRGGARALFEDDSVSLAPGTQIYHHEGATDDDLDELRVLLARRCLRLEVLGPRWHRVRFAPPSSAPHARPTREAMPPASAVAHACLHVLLDIGGAAEVRRLLRARLAADAYAYAMPALDAMLAELT